MEFKFDTKELHEQSEHIVFGAFEGDNEIAIIDAGSNGSSAYMLVVISMVGSVELHNSEHRTLPGAFEALAQFLKDEYSIGAPLEAHGPEGNGHDLPTCRACGHPGTDDHESCVACSAA